MSEAFNKSCLEELGLSDPIKLPVLHNGNGIALSPENDAGALMGAVLSLSTNPNVDAEKMERMLAMYRSIKADNAKTEYYRALALMKPKLPIIDRNGRIEVREKTSTGKRDGALQQSTGYALYEDIDEAITPILADHGFVLTYRTGQAADGKVQVTGVLAHTAGHIEETLIVLPHDSSGSKNNVQAVGSSLTYGKRYAATMLLNIRTKGEDDDGNSASGNDTISSQQMDTILDLIERAKADLEAFCEYMGVKAVKDILAKDYRKAIQALNTKLHRSAQNKEAAQ